MPIFKFLWLAIRPVSKLEAAVGWGDVVNLLILAGYITIPNIPQWQKSIPYVPLVWFAGIPALLFLIAGIKLQFKLGKLETISPDISVKPDIQNDRAVLEVTNIGGEADFTAKARVIATMPQAELYTMYWESVPSISCHIDGNGGIATILVGEKAKYDNKTMDVNTFFMKGDLILFKMGTSGEQVFPVCSGQRTEYVENGKKVIWGTVIQRCIIEITLTATPRLKKKWGTHKYLLEIDEESREISLCETELSSPHIHSGGGENYGISS